MPDTVTVLTNTRVHPLVRQIWCLANLNGMTQAALARVSGVNPSAISLLLTGRNAPTLFTLECLAGAVGYRVELVPASTPPGTR